jgi:2-succinyl-5-enolpyruvyl-6-hydroxy-3-cyclohexene-1-carboxylate synthase
VLADPLSGLRYGVPDRSLILSRYDSFLRRHDFANQFQPDWVLRFGALPVSRVLQAYLAAAGGASQILVTPFHPWPDPDHTAGWVIHSDPVLLCRTLLDSAIQAGDSGWAAAFLAAEQRAAVLEARQELPPEAYILRHIAFACPAGSRIFAGNSMVIRDVDSFWPSDAKDMLIIANRGASGIDGNVATALGIAAASSGRVIALLGDVALYHDMTALANARGLAAIFIVFNNGGGGIFEYLPQAGLPQFERYWLTPPALEIGKIADLFEVDYFSADSAPAFGEAFDAALKLDRSSLIEVKVDRPVSVALHKDFWAAVSSQPD